MIPVLTFNAVIALLTVVMNFYRLLAKVVMIINHLYFPISHLKYQFENRFSLFHTVLP